MRLHIHHEVGSGDGLFVSDQRDREPITMTPAEIIYQRRVAVLDHAARTGNVAETCRIFGISRTRYYQWKNVADRYGLDALVPKARRTPQMPEATPTHVVQALLTLAVVEPTIGCRQYAEWGTRPRSRKDSGSRPSLPQLRSLATTIISICAHKR